MSKFLDSTSLVTCNPDVSWDFLEKFLPNTMRALTAIWPKGVPGLPEGEKDIQTVTFQPHEEEKCKAWIRKMNEAGWNLFFLPNPPRYPLTRKARKEDIKEVRHLFVDIDLRAGENLLEEQKRIKDLLMSNLPPNAPEPTFIISSGGGMWGFWKLSEAVILPEAKNE